MIRHQVYFDTLGSMKEDSASWRSVFAGLSVLRLVGDGADEIEKRANSEDAGLLVAGAYGHSRLREAVFGGATRTFLTSSVGPHLFLAH